jgi:integral membrane sensor domain MASE1
MPIQKTILLNIWVAFAYFLAGTIGDLLSLEPSNSSPVWPASGVALAMTLIYGWRILTGLFVGVFFTQIYVSFGWAIIDALDNALAITLIKAFASSLQAIVGMPVSYTHHTQPTKLPVYIYLDPLS